MKKLLKLKEAILLRSVNQRWLSRETGIPEAHISMAIHGRYNLDPVQKAAIARALSCDEMKLFEPTAILSTTAKADNLVESRHPGESRGPEPYCGGEKC